jgi:NAD/NADP transhydrogenase beta subunit
MPNGLLAWAPSLAPFVIVAIVLMIRFRTLRRPRRLRLGMLWIVPTLYLAITVTLFVAAPPTPGGWVAIAIALPLGGLVGWYRGRTMAIEVDPVTHALSQRGSPAAMLFIVAIIAVRSALRAASESGEAAAWHVDATMATEVLVAFALGLLAMTRMEMWLRARRLLAEARAAV